MRMSVALIAGGTAVVLVALVLMWRSIATDETPAAQPGPTTAGEPASSSRSATSPNTRSTPSAVPGLPPAASAPGNRPALPSDPSSPSTSSEDAPPATRLNTKNLHFGGTQLRAQTAAVEPLVRQCVEHAAASGVKPTGNAVLTYIIAKKGDKYLVEDTGVDLDKTSLANEQLLDCLRETARSMQFEGLPREANALVVTRSVKIDNGALTEHKHVGFSYMR